MRATTQDVWNLDGFIQQKRANTGKAIPENLPVDRGGGVLPGTVRLSAHYGPTTPQGVWHPSRDGTDHDVKTGTKPCYHVPTLAVVEHTPRGYRIRCLVCEEAGPERDGPGEAFDAYDATRRRRR